MGEPLQNPRIFDAVEELTNPDALGMSARSLSISTVGIIPGLVKLNERFPQVNVAWSLHSPLSKQLRWQ